MLNDRRKANSRPSSSPKEESAGGVGGIKPGKPPLKSGNSLPPIRSKALIQSMQIIHTLARGDSSRAHQLLDCVQKIPEQDIPSFLAQLRAQINSSLHDPRSPAIPSDFVRGIFNCAYAIEEHHNLPLAADLIYESLVVLAERTGDLEIQCFTKIAFAESLSILGNKDRAVEYASAGLALVMNTPQQFNQRFIPTLRLLISDSLTQLTLHRLDEKCWKRLELWTQLLSKILEWREFKSPKIQSSPLFVEARLSLGLAESALKNEGGRDDLRPDLHFAQAMYCAKLESEPRFYPLTLQQYGLCLARAGKFADAREHLLEARARLRRAPSIQNAATLLGEINHNLLRIKEISAEAGESE